MRTATSEQILGPVAEAIGEFLLANEEAELNDMPLPDLFPAAEGVALSTKGLLAIATSMVDTSEDDDFKTDMPLACLAVETSAEQLVESTRKLRDEPMDYMLRQEMITAAKGILTGTGKVLEAFDDQEVRRIVRCCTVARFNVDLMGQVQTVDDLSGVAQPTCQTLIQLNQLADARIGELLNAWAKNALAEQRDAINSNTNILVSSTKAYVMNMEKSNATESRALCITNLKKAIDEIERIVQINQGPGYSEYQFPEGDIYKARKTVREALFDIHRAVLAGDPVALEAAMNAFNPASQQLLDQARAVAARADPVRRAEILASIDRIEKLKKELAAAAKYAAEHPDDMEAQRRVADLLRQLDNEFDNLDRLVNEALADEASIRIRALENHNNVDTPIGQLYQKARAGDVAGVDHWGRIVQEEADKLRDASRKVADACRDPEAARAVRTAQSNLDDLLPQVLAAAKNAAKNPNDPNAIEHLDTVMAEWESGVAKLKVAMDNAQNAEDIIAAQSKALRSELDRFENACKKQDAEQLKSASQGVTARVQRVIEVANKEIENSTDAAYQESLREQMGELQKTLPQLQGAAKSAFVNPNDAAAAAQLHEVSDKLVNAVDTIQRTVAEQHNPNADLKWEEVQQNLANLALEAEARKNAVEAVEVFEEDPVPAMSAEEMSANPIKAAAYSLKSETNKWDDANNPMVKTAARLADLMAMLNDFSKSGSKKDLINTAKQIAEEVKAIEAEARKTAQNCTDKRLQKELMTVSDRIPTMATQLKILATVKAANPDDNDNEQMLVLCATNLLDSVKTTINASQAAEIRSMKVAGNVALAAVKWKRKIKKTNAEPVSLASMVTSSSSTMPKATPAATTTPAAAAAAKPSPAAAAVSAFSAPKPAVAAKAPAAAPAAGASIGTKFAPKTFNNAPVGGMGYKPPPGK